MAGFRKTAYEYGLAREIKLYSDAEAADLHTDLASARDAMIKRKGDMESNLLETIHLFDQATAIASADLLKSLSGVHGEFVLSDSEARELDQAIERIRAGDKKGTKAVWAVYSEHVGDASDGMAEAKFMELIEKMYTYIVKVKQEK